jgi:hypothetical protein
VVLVIYYLSLGIFLYFIEFIGLNDIHRYLSVLTFNRLSSMLALDMCMDAFLMQMGYLLSSFGRIGFDGVLLRGFNLLVIYLIR